MAVVRKCEIRRGATGDGAWVDPIAAVWCATTPRPSAR